MVILTTEDIETFLKEAYAQLDKHVEKFTSNGSGWILDNVLSLSVNIAKYQPLKGSSYIELPKYLKDKKAIVNVKNQDDECLKWALLAALHPVKKDPQRVNKYMQFKELRFTEVDFPTPLSQMPKVERLNNLAINVFGYSKQAGIHPLYLTKDLTPDPINLLMITEVKDGKVFSHYCWIKNFDKLCHDQTKHEHRLHYCLRCISPHSSERTLQDHLVYCRGVDAPPCHAVFPEVNLESMYLPETKFRHFQNMIKAPYVVYADTESIIRPTTTPTTNSNTTQTSEHVPCSYFYIVVRSDGEVTNMSTYCGEDCMDEFFSNLECEIEKIRNDLKNIRPLEMTKEDRDRHRAADLCWVCDGPFEDYQPGDTHCLWKVQDHDHITGEYRGAAHSKCNLLLRINAYHTPVPVFFHNLKNYDAHHLMSAIGRTEVEETVCTDKNGQPLTYEDKKGVEKKVTVRDGGITAIVQNMEKMISFSWGQFRFVDSYAFLSSSLGQLVTNTPKKDLRITRLYIKHCLFNLITRKGVFPYEYMDSFERFEETQLPPKEKFYSSLTDESISDSDYQHAQEVWATFNCKNLKDYHDVYLSSDVLLLADVFENFRRTALSTYKLDPAHYLTLPGYSWDALLKSTEVSLELITDPDMYLFIEKGLRGGISMVSHRHAIANNPQMENYDPEQPTSFLQYLDANNLYGWAMSQPMPTRNFDWVDYSEKLLDTPPDSSIGYFLEVDLEYPASLHSEHNDNPLAPEKLTITRDQMSPYQQKLIEELGVSMSCEKLVPNLMGKSRYILHYRNLQLYLLLGMKITKVHKVLEFEQSPWMQPYIQKNTQLRTQAKNDFEKDFFKLMNNAVFGKTMENVRKRVNVKLLRSDEEQKILKLVAKPTFARQVIFNPDLVGIQNHKEKVLLNKPIYVGMSVLDLSKHLMYDFYYNHLKKTYGENVRLLYTDTDSVIIHVTTEDIYADMMKHADLYDTSNYSPDHQLFSDTNKKVIGKMKDELGGRLMTEFIGLRPKMYSYDGEDSGKRAKGVKKSVLKKTLTHEDYKKCLLDKKVFSRDMSGLRSYKHTIHGETVHKVALAPLDTKRYILDDGISTLAFGHVDIPTEPHPPAPTEVETPMQPPHP